MRKLLLAGLVLAIPLQGYWIYEDDDGKRWIMDDPPPNPNPDVMVAKLEDIGPDFVPDDPFSRLPKPNPDPLASARACKRVYIYHHNNQ